MIWIINLVHCMLFHLVKRRAFTTNFLLFLSRWGRFHQPWNFKEIWISYRTRTCRFLLKFMFTCWNQHSLIVDFFPLSFEYTITVNDDSTSHWLIVNDLVKSWSTTQSYADSLMFAILRLLLVFLWLTFCIWLHIHIYRYLPYFVDFIFLYE